MCIIVLWFDSGVECVGVLGACAGVMASVITRGVLGRVVWFTGVK